MMACAAAYTGLFVFRGFGGNADLSAWMLNLGLLIPTCAMIFGAAHDFGRWLANHSLVRLGDASYSIYLLHLIVAEYFAFTHPLDPTHENTVSAIARFIAALAVVQILSLLSYQYFEAPARRWLRALLTRRPSVPISAYANPVT